MPSSTPVHPVVVLAASDIPAAPVLGVMAFGVVVAVFGHIGRNYRVVAIGLALLFLATAAMVISGYAAFHQDPSDPRKCGIVC